MAQTVTGVVVENGATTQMEEVTLLLEKGNLEGTVILEDNESATRTEVIAVGTSIVTGVSEDGSWALTDLMPETLLLEFRGVGQYADRYKPVRETVTVFSGRTDELHR